jgi:hypothetical protein
MTTPVYNDTNFRAQFPVFANMTTYPEAMLSGYWAMGSAYISTNNVNCVWTSAQAQLANDLMAAHLAQSFTLINNGVPVVLVQGSTEGSVTVSVTPPPVKSSFGYWLATTPYGMQLRALLKAVAGVGLYVGGLPERSAFRKVAGIF